jgi:hypothetical protein
MKQNIFIQKLKDKYQDIVILTFEKNIGNIRIGFIDWGPENKLFFYMGNKNQSSYWIKNVQFISEVRNNGSIGPCHLNDEFNQLCVILDKLLLHFSQYESSSSLL